MSRYWAPSRWAGSGRLAGEIRSSEVESPMCATDWQEVRGPGTVFAAARGAADPELPGTRLRRRPRRGRSRAAVVRDDAAGAGGIVAAAREAARGSYPGQCEHDHQGQGRTCGPAPGAR